MNKIKRNQLAELIVEDGQPARAIINYLQETLELLNNFDCVTDYYTKREKHPFISSAPDLKLTKSLFLDAVSMAHGQLREFNEKTLELSDLYMNLNFILNKNDVNDDVDEDSVGYYLSTDIDGLYNKFMIIFKDEEPIISNIDVCYYGDISDFIFKSKNRFKETKKDNEDIYFTLTRTDGEGIVQYNEKEIKYIIPLNKISF